jgi:hypothetical protein
MRVQLLIAAAEVISDCMPASIAHGTANPGHHIIMPAVLALFRSSVNTAVVRTSRGERYGATSQSCWTGELANKENQS